MVIVDREMRMIQTAEEPVHLDWSSPDFPVKVNRCSLHFIHSDD